VSVKIESRDVVLNGHGCLTAGSVECYVVGLSISKDLGTSGLRNKETY
jgi:hypothetical protein